MDPCYYRLEAQHRSRSSTLRKNMLSYLRGLVKSYLMIVKSLTETAVVLFFRGPLLGVVRGHSSACDSPVHFSVLRFRAVLIVL